MDCNKQSIGYLCVLRTSLECCGFSNLDTGSFPLAVAHPVWSRFWSFEVIISACVKIWEVSWKPPMDCDTQIIKLSGIVVLFPHFFGKIGPFLPIVWKKLLFWYRTFAVVLGIRLIHRRWKGCRFWDVPFTVCCGFPNLDTGSSCHSLSSVIALLVVWSDHLSVHKNLRSFVEASDKFLRSLRWIAIHKKSNCLGWLSYFPIFWEHWTFFATFLEIIVVLAGCFCSFMDIIISGKTYR